ncbi:DUF3732 domain-containing protein [Yersinia mollaretii]|uniref:DUF3732 domain-containing protein n=1 Tax=Yersinia mollaretii TaxID=33060 RepID=UPI001427E6FE|nr:DUF3732 domain-containing protein [Yersinia mollaretii]MDA5534909.1 DUF3732 domain-containing protein [Yersinia mollaretii]NIL02826.1 DUF3732 domain-containing protein [Yersinia mollaretii]
MNCYVNYIGIIDNKNRTHAVKFTPGVNIITGKSSTGKSAIIEIFDYCLGSSEDNIPVGVITRAANYYFTVLKFNNFYLVLARKNDSKYAFIRTVEKINEVNRAPEIPIDFFDNSYFLPLSSFNKELGRYFNITMTSVDDSFSTNRRKKPTPSIRSFMSYMLQHQNLIANKHALFYRFDEKEKREQAINHLPIFLGFVDQEYFILLQEQDDIESKIKRLNYSIPRKNEEKQKNISEIIYLSNMYLSVTGTRICDTSPEEIQLNPSYWLEKIRSEKIVTDSASSNSYILLKQYESDLSVAISEKRKLERERILVNSSIKNLTDYSAQISKIIHPTEFEIRVSNCPFCAQENNNIVAESNKLYDAINWLNKELSSTPYARESFREHDLKLKNDIEKISKEITDIEKKIKEITKQEELLKKKTSIIELAHEARARLIIFLESLATNKSSDLILEKENLDKELIIIQKKIKALGIENKIRTSERYLINAINEIGNKLDFETSYKPVNLKFSLESFDLWHENKDESKTFLRSMGSGANWLYCHLALFLGINKLFCKLNSTCKIPPILFLDQPSQVYFPNFDNSKEKFNPMELLLKSGTFKDDNSLNHDISAVENFFNVMIEFCDTTLEETKLMPQIIISDHADNLQLSNNKSFGTYVRARWRDRGFIHPEIDQ